MALYYAPQFDDPEDPGVYAQTPNVDIATAPESADGYGDASVPTQMDYAQPAIDAGRATQSEAERYAAAARASVEAINQQAMLAQDPEYRANAAAVGNRTEAAALRGELPGTTSIYARAPVRSAPRPGHVPTKRLTTALGTTEAPALNAESAAAQKEIGRATVAEAAATTEALQQLADRQRALNIDAQASALARSEQIRNARAKVEQTNSEVAKMASEFSRSSEVDPGRFWASRTALQKFAAVLSSAMLGFAGMDPFSHLQAAVREDIDAQRSNIDLRRAKLGAAENVAARQRSSLDDLRATLQDDQLAENALYMSKMEAAKAQVIAMLQEAGQQVTGASVQKLFTDIDKDLARVNYENEMIAERNTPTVAVGGGYIMSAEERADRRKRAMAADAGARDAEARGGKVLEQREAAGVDLQKERIKQSGKADLQKQSVENKRLIAKETAKARRVHTLASDLLADIAANGGDVPGVGSASILGEGFQHTLTADAKNFRRKLEALSQYDITDLTGAASSPGQQRVIADFLSSDSLSEDQILSGLREIQSAMNSYISTFEAVDPQAAKELRRNAGVSEEGLGGARVNLPRGQSSVVEED